VTCYINSWGGAEIPSSNNLCLPLEFVSNHENSPCGINPSKHVARVVVVIYMTEAIGESFSLDEFKTSVIENVVAVPVFVAERSAKFLTMQKLDEQLLFKL
jgi:hypothetical protein